MRLKNYKQFNESMSEITRKFVDEVSGEIKKILESSIEFFQDLNDILISHEDDGKDFEYEGFYLSCTPGGGSPTIPFGIDFSKSEIEVEYDDVEYFLNENGIRKSEKAISGIIYAQSEIMFSYSWKNSDIYNLLEEIHRRVDCLRILINHKNNWIEKDYWKARIERNENLDVDYIRITKKIDIDEIHQKI